MMASHLPPGSRPRPVVSSKAHSSLPPVGLQRVAVARCAAASPAAGALLRVRAAPEARAAGRQPGHGMARPRAAPLRLLLCAAALAGAAAQEFGKSLQGACAAGRRARRAAPPRAAFPGRAPGVARAARSLTRAGAAAQAAPSARTGSGWRCPLRRWRTTRSARTCGAAPLLCPARGSSRTVAAHACFRHRAARGLAPPTRKPLRLRARRGCCSACAPASAALTRAGAGVRRRCLPARSQQVQCWREPPCIRWSWLSREKCRRRVRATRRAACTAPRRICSRRQDRPGTRAPHVPTPTPRAAARPAACPTTRTIPPRTRT